MPTLLQRWAVLAVSSGRVPRVPSDQIVTGSFVPFDEVFLPPPDHPPRGVQFH